jgi:two-component system cell cycle sensor histidine kinase/response regulator CckA
MAVITPSTYPKPRRVLVVDDEELILGVAARLLRRLPVEVDTARSGLEAMRKLELAPFRYDLVMLDLTMPEPGGRKVLEAIQRLRVDLPVVIMSGLSAEESKDVLNGLSCQGFLGKPFALEDVRNLVRRMLPE